MAKPGLYLPQKFGSKLAKSSSSSAPAKAATVGGDIEESKLGLETSPLDITSEGPSQRRRMNPFLAQNSADSGAYMDTPKPELLVPRNPPSEREMEIKAAPEKYITIFAMRLALLEKIASGAGTLSFIWATVVVLGGYAITLKEIDFWVVTIILTTEGARIFSRSHELEWLQHENASKAFLVVRSKKALKTALSAITPGHSAAAATMHEMELPAAESPVKEEYVRHRRTLSSSTVSLVPYMSWIFKAKHVSRILSWAQVASALLCISLSVWRLVQHDYIKEDEVDTANNHASALFMFFSLAILEASVFLLERIYWWWKIDFCRILAKVNKMCGLNDDSLPIVRRFFYDVYSKCIDSSVFQGLKMDLVSYCIDLILSDDSEEQLKGMRVLAVFVGKDEFKQDTLRKIGTMQGIVERLLEMITWKNRQEQEVRRLAADVLSSLVKYDRNSIRVAAIGGSIEAIYTLLEHTGEEGRINLHVVGLRILKNLGKDESNCIKIGNTRGVIKRLVAFIDVDRKHPQGDDSRLGLVRKSLELLRTMATTSGQFGAALRENIADEAYTLYNLRNILEYYQDSPSLQQRAVEILVGLVFNEKMREAVGQTGGMIRCLIGLLLNPDIAGDGFKKKLAAEAGKVVLLLCVQSQKNCERLLNLKLAGEPDIVLCLLAKFGNWEEANLGDSEAGYCAAMILYSLCEYSDSPARMRPLISFAPKVLKMVMKVQGRLQEATIGLVASIIKLMTKEEVAALFSGGEAWRVSKAELVARLSEVLTSHPKPSRELIRIRRFSMELAIALVEKHEVVVNMNEMVQLLHQYNFMSHVHNILDSSSNLENFATFSGSVGVTRYGITAETLAKHLLAKLQQPDL